MNVEKSENSAGALQKIVVFQQNGSGESKIAGLRKYAAGVFELEVISIDTKLPPLLEDGRQYLPRDISADLVLDYLKHQDLSCDLVALCAEKGIPIISSGKKLVNKWVLTPPTCCGLPRQEGLGQYGERFGAPEFEVTIVDDKIAEVRVIRGASCGASWEAAKRLIGTPVADAARKIGLDVQFFCSANPAGWDPIYGKSPVHFAGKIHSRMLLNAIEKAIAKMK
jgi:thymidylate synthase